MLGIFFEPILYIYLALTNLARVFIRTDGVTIWL